MFSCLSDFLEPLLWYILIHLALTLFWTFLVETESRIIFRPLDAVGHFITSVALFHTRFYPYEGGMFLCDEATQVPSSLPKFSEQKLASNKGTLRLQLHYRKSIPILQLFADRRVKKALLNGGELIPVKGNFYLKLSSIPSNDLILELEYDDQQGKLAQFAVAHDYFLLAGALQTPMPDDMMTLSNIPDFNWRLFKKR